MSNESTVWNTLPENSTEIPLEAAGRQDGYVLLLVILSIFLVGSLVIIAVLLLVCRRCGRRGQRCGRASDDPEKTNTTYLEDSQPTHEITIRVDESECLPAGSSHDQETERFLSTGTTGRRVSFNEAALFDHGKKAQEKGRRYTLTEGDFHHLKNARLTHLHIPAPALKILTIPECDSAENTITMATRPATKSALSIFQPMLCPLTQAAMSSLSPSSRLPGDTFHPVGDTGFTGSPSAPSSKPRSTSSIEIMGPMPRGLGSPTGLAEAGLAAGGGGGGHGGLPGEGGAQGPVLQFFTKLRRHASLEGASPYFKIKKWKLDSSQRASSLDTRGSPKRRQFQRQRAASESMDQGDEDAHRNDLIQYIARTQDVAYCPGRAPARRHSPPSTPPPPSPSLGRLEVEVMVEPCCSHLGPGVIGLSPEPQDEALTLAAGASDDPLDSQAVYRDIWNLRASLEQYAASDQSSSNNDRNSVCSDVDSVCSPGGRAETARGGLPSNPSQDLGDEAEAGDEDGDPAGSKEAEPRPEGRKKKQGSVDSERGGSDGETGNRKLLQMDSGYASIEAPCRGTEDLRLFGPGSNNGSPKDRTALERRHHFTSAGRSGTVGESFESHLFEEEPEEEAVAAGGASGGVAIATGAGPLGWSPYGQMFTPREAVPPAPPARPLTLHRRDYSIDEKTDALFHEFLRHDPQFDQQESPAKKHRSRVHLRKQWQRHKQWSDPGVRHFHSSFERQRTPLRRGDSVSYLSDASYHVTLPRIVSAPDEEASDGTGSAPETPKLSDAAAASKTREAEREPLDKGRQGTGAATAAATGGDREETQPPPPPLLPPLHRSISEKEGRSEENPDHPQEERGGRPLPPAELSPPSLPHSARRGPQTITAELTDKLTAGLEERLYAGLRQTKDISTAAALECVAVTVARASPDHSPV